MIADVCGRHVVVPEGRQFGAKGAALLAGVAIGVFADVQATATCTRPARVHAPDPAAHRRYSDVFALYRHLRTSLLPVWQQAAHLRS
jgi:sugar (pentulose or hexulose) kinase